MAKIVIPAALTQAHVNTFVISILHITTIVALKKVCSNCGDGHPIIIQIPYFYLGFNRTVALFNISCLIVTL